MQTSIFSVRFLNSAKDIWGGSQNAMTVIRDQNELRLF
jgi:hypothetical protein